MVSSFGVALAHFSRPKDSRKKNGRGAVSWVALLSMWIYKKKCWFGLPVQSTAVLILCPLPVFKFVVNIK